ncbi:abhydrolase domain-containing protein 11 [Chaetoceros tenuissimus]|uniref:Abhydrolase domain-containing protein 11 n=1 Tax=Chaetoceros tenuissimus TaxID=426638 RepID=A0AAD3D221_9STRA|nr:abhydrolase domain-containing protein 11 [Chaetoceros tenuissimus]
MYLHTTQEIDTNSISHVDLKYIEFTTDETVGNGRDPVILLHGLLGQKRNFASLGTSLALQLEHKRRIFAVDLRNHGDSTDWRSEMSYSQMAEDIRQFMDNVGIEKAVLIGHSMGGKCAKAMALTYPDRVSGLIVLDISPVRYTEDTLLGMQFKIL